MILHYTDPEKNLENTARYGCQKMPFDMHTTYELQVEGSSSTQQE
jgi:hypothetical protein